MIWVYGICDRPDTPAPRADGLGQSPLEGVREGELLAAVSRHDDLPEDPVLDALWIHELVIERLMTDRAVLPMRFGTKFADDDALHEVLAGRQQEFLTALDRVRGRVELGIRALQPHEAQHVATPVSGRAYLESKLRDGREAAALHEPLAALAAASTRHAARPDELLRASYLVDTEAVPRFRATVERLQRNDADVAVLCTGPWPPYSFTT